MAEYQNVYASITRFVQEFVKGRPAKHPAHFVDFDQHATTTTLPEGDLVGIRGLSMNTTDTTFMVQVMFGISTGKNDKNLFRHRQIVDDLFGLVLPTKQIPYIDAADANRLGFMVARSGTAVLPISRAETRAFQQIQVTLLGDRKPEL